MTNKNFSIEKRTFRPLSELNIIDDFLFQQLLSQEGDSEEFCRILLSTILGRPIRKVRIIPQKNILGIDINRHGIRMDAYIEDTTLSYNDGATKIFLYTKGTEGNPSQELRDMLKYIENTTTDNITNQSIDTVHQFVEKVKRRREVGINYMKSWELEKMWKEEGRLEGISILIETCQEFHISKEDTLNRIMQKFNLSHDTAAAYIEEYWQD